MTMRIEPDDLRGYAATARAVAPMIADAGAGGSDPSSTAVGHPELAAAIGELRARAWSRAQAVSTHVEESGTFLEETAARWEAVDEAISAALGPLAEAFGVQP